MSLLLAGLTVLVIGDSHMTQDYLISTLHDELMQQGAKVYSFGACGSSPGDWLKAVQPPCGSAYRLDKGKIRNRVSEAASTRPLPDLIKQYQPNLIVVINGDTMVGYKRPVLPKTWIWDEVTSLTHAIKDSGTSCVWVGPAWGTEGGMFGKTFAKVKAMSDYLGEIVSPCTYINSLEMSSPGEWRTGDGVHFEPYGYRAWGSAITRQIISSDILQKIRLKPGI